MNSKKLSGWYCATLILVAGLSAFLFFKNDSAPGIEQKIRASLNTWSHDFNMRKTSTVCDLFSPDLIAVFSGIADKNYQEMCSNFSLIFADRDKQYFYEEPQIEQILVKDDLAIVRLIWTLNVKEKGQKETVIKEKSLDIFKRQPDGSWKISIFYAFIKN